MEEVGPSKMDGEEKTRQARATWIADLLGVERE
jgi:hypothetical protein